jgi:hypothetical protein
MHILAVERVVALLFAVSMEHMHLFACDAGIYGRLFCPVCSSVANIDIDTE